MAIPVVIPLVGVASQTLSITLGNQPCNIDVFTKHIQVPLETEIPTTPPPYGVIDPVFLNLRVNDEPVLGGVLARNNVALVRGFCAAGPVFVGELSFGDTEGNEEPQWPGLGTRWKLYYWS